jgi:hypothetical protein
MADAFWPALFLEAQLRRYKPQHTLPGLIIVLLGVPVHGLWKKSAARIISPQQLWA